MSAKGKSVMPAMVGRGGISSTKGKRPSKRENKLCRQMMEESLFLFCPHHFITTVDILGTIYLGALPISQLRKSLLLIRCPSIDANSRALRAR